MKRLCCAPQPGDASRHCIRFHDHTGPHQTFVAEWNDGDINSRRRPALHFKAARPTADRNIQPNDAGVRWFRPPRPRMAAALRAR